MNIIEACQHPEIFKPWFRKPETYRGWFAFLAALFGLPMDDEQLELYQKHTGRKEAPTEAQREAWLVIGRRGGKSFTMALVAVFLACFFDYRQYLAPGERATVLVIAADRRQARTIIRYVRAMLNNIPLLHAMVERDTADSFDLDNFVTIEVGSASFRSTRGYTYAAVLCDELAFWRTDDAAEPDYAILDAIRPGMASIPTSMLLCASSPHARRGALWDAFKRYFGKEGQPLVWKAATREMNPTIPQSVVDGALERDQSSASAEYMAEFRSDIEQFVNIEVVEACVSPGVFERPYVSGIRYRAFVDPSGGSNDSMTLAIGHNEGGRATLDCVRERKPPFSPEAVVLEFAETLDRYRVREVEGDRYAGEWPREQFRK
ncbi:MAG: terminase family protein, partial [Pararhizobium sp.]